MLILTVQSCSPQPTQSHSLVPTSCFLKGRASKKDPSSFRLGIIIVGKEIFRILCVRRSGKGQQDSLIGLDRKHRSTGKSYGSEFCPSHSCVSLKSASAKLRQYLLSWWPWRSSHTWTSWGSLDKEKKIYFHIIKRVCIFMF